mmetsp:Transcript_18081/g.48649  ORF Transcript_18081/g.48649 Transcript_18081/m.48649 type:complete len:188 (+) Transcript_18081:1508-2071(+)
MASFSFPLTIMRTTPDMMRKRLPPARKLSPGAITGRSHQVECAQCHVGRMGASSTPGIVDMIVWTLDGALRNTCPMMECSTCLFKRSATSLDVLKLFGFEAVQNAKRAQDEAVVQACGCVDQLHRRSSADSRTSSTHRRSSLPRRAPSGPGSAPNAPRAPSPWSSSSVSNGSPGPCAPREAPSRADV